MRDHLDQVGLWGIILILLIDVGLKAGSIFPLVWVLDYTKENVGGVQACAHSLSLLLTVDVTSCFMSLPCLLCNYGW